MHGLSFFFPHKIHTVQSFGFSSASSIYFTVDEMKSTKYHIHITCIQAQLNFSYLHKCVMYVWVGVFDDGGFYALCACIVYEWANVEPHIVYMWFACLPCWLAVYCQYYYEGHIVWVVEHFHIYTIGGVLVFQQAFAHI